MGLIKAKVHEAIVIVGGCRQVVDAPGCPKYIYIPLSNSECQALGFNQGSSLRVAVKRNKL